MIIPPPGHQQSLDALHACHPGMTKMKGLARATLWWPKLDQAIEDKVKYCHMCQVNQNAPVKAPLHPGSGRNVHGREYISIMRDRITINCG